MKKIFIYSLLTVFLAISALMIFLNFTRLVMICTGEIANYLIPFGLAIGGYLLIVRRRLSFVENFFHEITHVLFSLLFFEKVKHFYASSTHGEVQTNSTFPNVFSTLSPYFFPVFTFLLIAIWSIFDLQQLNVIIIISYGCFIAIVIKQILANNYEALSFSWYGILLIILMNFWISLFVFAWTSGNIELVFKSLTHNFYEFNGF